jgi:WD40 repeat protein
LLYNWSHSKETDVGIIAVDISPDGKRAVTATEKDMALWDTSTGQNLGFYSLPESDLRDIAISDRGEFLIMGLGNGKVIHLNLKTGRRLEFLLHGEAINSLDISPNGRYVLSSGNDYRAIFWDSKTGQALHQWQHNSRVILVALSRDGSRAFSTGNKANAFIWNLKTGEKIAQLDLSDRQYVLSSARFSLDNQLLLTGSPSRQLILWNANDGQAQQQIRVSPRYTNRPSGAIIYAVGFTSDGDLLTESSAGFGERWQVSP